MEPKPQGPEELFRGDLASVIAVVKTLAPLCKTPQDLVGMAELALVNDGQLALLMEKCQPLRMRR